MAGRLGEGDVVAGRFVIERLVARGGMGTVYRGLDRESGLPAAIKTLDVEIDAPEGADRFAREVRLLAGLRHPRIVEYVGHGETAAGRPYLAMQWLDGEDLKTALARGGPLSLRDARLVLEGAAEALAEVHAAGIIHRDLKPANLFLRGGSSEDVVLLDFGIARRLDNRSRITSTGALLGTPHYMAPEQATEIKKIGPSTDIFSLGCIFHECLTGKPPFDASHPVGVLAKILFDAPEPVQRLRPSVPRAFTELLARMLTKDPARRPQDGAALLRELAELPSGGEASAFSSIPPRASQIPESGEQALVCAVLAVPPKATLPVSEDDPMSTWLAHPAEELAAARSAMRRFGLRVEGLADGSLVATIFSGGAATDQARIAARGALYLRDLLPNARIAMATGRAPLGQTTCVGEAVSTAAGLLDRAESLTRGAEGVWIDDVTAGLLDARFLTALAGGGVLLQGERPAADESRLLLGKPTPCVGRDLELAQLDGLMARVVDDGAADVALLIAPPGAGKSRLRREFLRRVRDCYPETQVLIGHGDPLTAGSPYGLVSDALRRHAEIRTGEDPASAWNAVLSRLCRRVEERSKRRVGEFLGELCGIPFSAEDSPPLAAARSDPLVMSEQIIHAFLDWIAAECGAQPVVLVLEDIQWGDMLTVKLLECALRERASDPLFVLALARPEAKDVFPALLSDKAQEIALRPLSRKASERLVREVLGDSVRGDSVARIVELAGGNALFLEELIRAAAEGKAGQVPGTVLAMLQARLAGLAPDARRVLRAGSIFGETFWLGAVQRLAEGEGSVERIERRLEHLVQVELIERRRQSRFPGEVEYVFRHALARDAAYSLLSESDRSEWHLAAGLWLEEAGETDAMALAWHAQEGGDFARAIAFYTRAADQSLARNDNEEAIARVAKGIACGAGGSALGDLESIRSLAFFGSGKWIECGAAGVAALRLLPEGSLRWCRTAEKLLQVLPQINEAERFEALVRDVERVEPLPEARAAHTCALSALSLGYSIVGARDRAERMLELVGNAGRAIFDHEHYGRGIARTYHSAFHYFIGGDFYLAVTLASQAVRDLEISQAMHIQSAALAVEGCLWSLLGDPQKAEEKGRRSLFVAEQSRSVYYLANARLYFSLSLSESSAPAHLEEAEHLARNVLEARVSPTYDATGHMVLAGLALKKGDYALAEAKARAGISNLTVLHCYSMLCTAHLIRALAAQGRTGEAAAAAKDGLSRLRSLKGTGFSEMAFRAAAVEALEAAGEREEAARVLQESQRVLEDRAESIPDPEMRRRFMSDVADNRRILELARLPRGASSRYAP